MKGKPGRKLRSDTVNNKHPEDVNRNKLRESPEENNSEESEESEDEQEGRGPSISDKAVEKHKKRVEFKEAVEVEVPKKPKTMPYVQVQPLKSPLKVRPAERDLPMPVIEKRAPAYKHKATIEDEVDQDEIIRKLKSQPADLTQGEVLGVANPQFRKRYVEDYIPKRIPVPIGPPSTSRKVTMIEEVEEPDIETEGQIVDTLIEELSQPEEPVKSGFMPMSALPRVAYRQLMGSLGDLPSGAIVLDDPYEVYLNSLGPDEVPKGLIVAQESQFLKAVFPFINGKEKAETLLDSGSQIVSMAQSTAERLSLTWDPEFVVKMQSANKQVESTKGLARNVPFTFGDITVYLQVHIMTNPAYDVLLGKPFEVLTESNVKTRRDGSVELTLTDPKDGRRLVIPTYDRGKGPDDPVKEQAATGFRSSMNC